MTTGGVLILAVVAFSIVAGMARGTLRPTLGEAPEKWIGNDVRRARSGQLAPHMVIVMHLTMWLDVITIATGIPIILVIANNRADHAPQDTTHGGTCARSNARNDRTRDRAGSGAYDRSSSAAGNDMISVGVANTTSQGKTAHGNDRD